MEKTKNEILASIETIKSFSSRFPQKFTKKNIAEVTGLSERSVHYYTDKGLVCPSINNPVGRGKTRIYGQENLVDFEVIKRLTAFGFSLEKIHEITNTIRKCRTFLFGTYKLKYENPNSGIYILIGYDKPLSNIKSTIGMEIAKIDTIKILFFVYGSDMEMVPKELPPPVRIIEMKSKNEEPQLAFLNTSLTLIINLTRIGLDAFLNLCNKINSEEIK
jgi:MerR HTH family regulatory protein